MSSNLPLRTIRIPALRQQCLFQRRRSPQLPRALSTTAPRAFAATCLRLARKQSQIPQEKGLMKAITRAQPPRPAQQVIDKNVQREGGMVEDIGLLQDTIVRASWDKLPKPLQRAFWAYMWKLAKSRVTGLYGRSVYKRCIWKAGWKRWLPIDFLSHKPIETIAQTLYHELYASFARGSMSPVSKFCLPPILESFQNRIAARGPVRMDWAVKGDMKAKVVSHRASMMGEDMPDTAFRQVVVRITSTQRLQNKFDDTPVAVEIKPSKARAPVWAPLDAKKPEKEAKSQPKKKALNETAETTQDVVEYLVLQKKLDRGVEDPHWMVWGFTQESTPQKIEEDAEYWRRMLDVTTGVAR